MSAQLTVEQVHEIKDRAIDLLIDLKCSSMFALSTEYGKKYKRNRSYLINLMRKHELTKDVMCYMYTDNPSFVRKSPVKLNPYAEGFSQNIAHTKAYLGGEL